MKLNVLSSSYVTESYKIAWQGNVYPYFHDSKYSFHYEVAKFFEVADEKLMNKLCSFLDDYVDVRADYTDFEEKLEKMLCKGKILKVMRYVFDSGQYKGVADNLKANKHNFSQHFVDRFRLQGYM
jgi:hypothetical protein